MVQNVQVSCIRKTDRRNPHERILGIGGINDDGTRWFMTEDRAIAAIEEKRFAFWTTGGGTSVWVVVATHLARKYLKTEADGVIPDNLLALPECP
jgi:hypothetical protein